MESLIHIMDYMESNDMDMSDPVIVTRFLSNRLSNTPDHFKNPYGLLTGSWSTYEGGKNPSSWQGSDEIYKEYVKNGFNPVKYGQCWVFGGTFTSALRALGIPARQVVTFASAHEEPPYKHEIKFILDSTGKVVDREGSIWNFHSWIEGWMSRKDLKSKYVSAGWQALDSTPQEKSDGMYRMGPASIRAIHDEDDSVTKYDTSFVISEVAAKAVYIVKDDNDKEVKRWSEPNPTQTVTQGVDNNGRVNKKLDLTAFYVQDSDSSNRASDPLSVKVVSMGEAFVGDKVTAELAFSTQLPHNFVKYHVAIYMTSYRGNDVDIIAVESKTIPIDRYGAVNDTLIVSPEIYLHGSDSMFPNYLSFSVVAAFSNDDTDEDWENAELAVGSGTLFVPFRTPKVTIDNKAVDSTGVVLSQNTNAKLDVKLDMSKDAFLDDVKVTVRIPCMGLTQTNNLGSVHGNIASSFTLPTKGFVFSNHCQMLVSVGSADVEFSGQVSVPILVSQ
jgi:hypothetical protein